MLKITIPKVFLIILISAFSLYLSGVAAERECWDREGGGPTFSGNYTYPPFQYDPNNPDEIDRNNSIPIRVIGGFPPYTQQVSGTGFSIPSSTTGRTNTLSADDTDSGAATIAVTDKYGAGCTGYVRCPTGSWHQHCGCGLIWYDGAYTASGYERPPGAYEVIVGKWKYRLEDDNWYRCLCKGGGGYGDYGGPAGSNPEGNHSLNCNTTNCASGDCWRNGMDI